MRSGKGFGAGILFGLLVGAVCAYTTVAWRTGAAAAMRDLYAVAAIEARQELQACQGNASPWPRRRGP